MYLLCVQVQSCAVLGSAPPSSISIGTPPNDSNSRCQGKASMARRGIRSPATSHQNQIMRIGVHDNAMNVGARAHAHRGVGVAAMTAAGLGNAGAATPGNAVAVTAQATVRSLSTRYAPCQMPCAPASTSVTQTQQRGLLQQQLLWRLCLSQPRWSFPLDLAPSRPRRWPTHGLALYPRQPAAPTQQPPTCSRPAMLSTPAPSCGSGPLSSVGSTTTPLCPIEKYNQVVAEEGLPLDQWRTF